MSNTHGGKREGSGRKKKETKQLTLKVPTQILEELNKKFPLVKDRNIEIIKSLKRLSKKS